MKKCTKCLISKKDEDFGNEKYFCKECAKLETQKYFRTKKGLVTRIYAHQKERCTSKKPTYTKQELKDWLFAQDKFHLLYDNWKRLDFQKDYAPSVDRIDDNIGYTISNIQLMTWKENNEKGFISRKNGDNVKASKAVSQYDKDGNFIARYFSMSEASKQTKVRQGNISNCCYGQRKTAGGYIWILEN